MDIEIGYFGSDNTLHCAAVDGPGNQGKSNANLCACLFVFNYQRGNVDTWRTSVSSVCGKGGDGRRSGFFFLQSPRWSLLKRNNINPCGFVS